MVISPLRALMFDQLRRCNEMGVRAVMLGQKNEMTSEDKYGKYLSYIIIIIIIAIYKIA